MAKSLSCEPEIITTFFICYTLIKFTKKKKKKKLELFHTKATSGVYKQLLKEYVC